MSRLEFIRIEKLKIILLVILTLALPFMTEWHNPAGAQPITMFSFVAALGWVGFIGMMIVPDSARKDFFNR